MTPIPLRAAGLAVLVLFAVPGMAQAPEKSVEVMHWWTSGSEGAALKVLKDDVLKRGFNWKDSAVAGGGGDQARVAVRKRVAAGSPPDALQMLGFSITAYAEEGLLGNVDAVATAEGWDKVVPLPVQKFSKFKGHWVAAPVNIHRTNWIWANKAIFDELKLAPPKTFDELLAAAERIRKAGYIPLAHGGQPWQTATLFDSAVMSAGGPKFYKEAMIDLDPKALGSKTMEKAFEQMLKLRAMVDPEYMGRDWNFATSMIYRKKAAMQIMGDWAKGEFAKAHMKPNADYLCFQYPGTEGSFIFNADQFGLLRVSDKQVAAQAAFASAVMDKDFQEKFNAVKGSIPARTDASVEHYDDCGKQSMADLKQSMKGNAMLGSFAHGYAMPDAPKAAGIEVVSKFFDSGKSAAAGAHDFARAVSGAK